MIRDFYRRLVLGGLFASGLFLIVISVVMSIESRQFLVSARVTTGIVGEARTSVQQVVRFESDGQTVEIPLICLESPKMRFEDGARLQVAYHPQRPQEARSLRRVQLAKTSWPVGVGLGCLMSLFVVYCYLNPPKPQEPERAKFEKSA